MPYGIEKLAPLAEKAGPELSELAVQGVEAISRVARDTASHAGVVQSAKVAVESVFGEVRADPSMISKPWVSPKEELAEVLGLDSQQQARFDQLPNHFFGEAR